MKIKTAVIMSIYSGRSFVSSFSHFHEGIVKLIGKDCLNVDCIRLATALKPYLLKSCPWLSSIQFELINKSNWSECLAESEKTFGKYQDIDPIPSGKILHLGPINALKFAGCDEDKIIKLDL